MGGPGRLRAGAASTTRLASASPVAAARRSLSEKRAVARSSSAGSAGATDPGGRLRKGGEAPLRVNSVGQRDEGVLAERVVDHALHRLDLRVRACLEAQGEVGVRVRRAHEAPAAAGEEHARPIGVDRLVPRLQLARQLRDHAELLAVGARRLQLGRGAEVRHRIEETRDGLGRAGRGLDDLAGGEDPVVHAVVVLGEEHVTAHLAAQEDALLAHLALEVRVPGLPHDGHAAMRPDVVDQRLRGLHVEDDLGSRVAPEEVAREQDQDEVGLVAPATLVDDAHAVGVAVSRAPWPLSRWPRSMSLRSVWISSSVRGAALRWTIFTPLYSTGLWLPVMLAPPSSLQCAVAK